MNDIMEFIQSLLAEANARVRTMPDRSVAVDIPSRFTEHGYVTVHVEWAGAGQLRLSDGGITAFELDGGIDQIAQHAQCAGLPFEADRDRLISVVDVEYAPGAAISRFAAALDAAPAMARLLGCASRREKPEATADVMAREMRGVLADRFPSLAAGSRMALKPKLAFGRITIRPRLAIWSAHPSSSLPSLACEFIDLASSPDRSINATYQSAAGTLQALAHIERRFLVVRGDSDEVDEMAGLFEPLDIVTVESSEPGALTASVAELEGISA